MTIQELPIVMVRCLVLTIIIELGIALILGVRDKKDMLNIVLVNIVTNPLVVVLPIVLVLFGYKCYATYRLPLLYVLEVLTVFVEGYIYHKTIKYKIINPYLLSLILNAGSYFIGEIINHFIGG